MRGCSSRRKETVSLKKRRHEASELPQKAREYRALQTLARIPVALNCREAFGLRGIPALFVRQPESASALAASYFPNAVTRIV